MTESPLDKALRDAGASDYLRRTLDSALARSIATDQNAETEQPEPARLPRFALVFESQGIAAYHVLVAGQNGTTRESVKRTFASAFSCWQALVSLADDGGPTRKGVSQTGVRILQEEFPNEPTPAELTLAFRLAVSGLLAQRPAETRLELLRFDFPRTRQDGSWRDQVVWHVFQGFVLLCRKHNGWTDIDAALKSIDRLRNLQRQHEDQYIENKGDPASQTAAAYELVGLYHLAQLLTTAGEYLKEGRRSLVQVNLTLDRHLERSKLSFEGARSPFLAHLAELLWVGCRELSSNAIWSHIEGLGERTREYARLLTSKGRPNPIIELWPSQQEALRRNMMDPYQRAILVEMPTSGGKTLLAKFLIVQTKALNPTGTVAYVVPTRALVNQVTIELRTDFRGLRNAIRVEQAVPAFELDPTEERLLADAPDVLVTTPEKFDLLVRKNHPVTQNISLVVVDEAHNLGTPDRGPRLELLLGMLRRDRAGVRFILLSPYLPNAEELVAWLGGAQALPPIAVDWKPSRKMVGAIRLEGRGTHRTLFFNTLPAADNTDVRAGMQVPITKGPLRETKKTISGLTRASVRAFLDRGAILVLCRGQGTASTRATELKDELPRSPEDEVVRAVSRYLEEEAGTRTSLVDCLEHGVAYHHAGLSQEARWLVESLIRQDKVKVVCGTTTLAQGVNFPISTVIVETLQKGEEELTYQDFWNIAGRAGRALVDTLGIVAFPTPSDEKLQEFELFLRGEATAIASQVASVVDAADEIAGRFDLETIARWPALSPLLQFLAHALHVSGRDDVADDVEDILRASLVFHQANRLGDQVARKLISICRMYLQSLRGNLGLVALAEQTGFATPSVFSMLDRTRQDNEFVQAGNWHPSRLFGQNIKPLTRRIQVIGNLPEIRLGAGHHPPFNPQRVALILRDWVSGVSLKDLTSRYPVATAGDESARIAVFSRYLFSELIGRASWGLGALETVSLAGISKDQWREVGYVPSMVYFGVRRREAVWLRMAGVPRLVADRLAELWSRSRRSDPNSFDEIRTWVRGLTEAEWRQVVPSTSRLTPADLRRLCGELVG